MQDFHFMTRMSKASPKLFLACANGQHMKEAKLVGVHAGAMQQEFLTWTFSDVLVSSYQTSGSGGDDLSMDAVSLAFSKVRVEYKAAEGRRLARQGDQRRLGPQVQQEALTGYDRVPYPGHPFAQTHPDRLATVATLFGLRPAPPEACRVLELGCGDGGNLVPMAYGLPGSTFCGVDLSGARDRAGARKWPRRSGSSNVRFELADLTALPALGEFDYVVAHGVYSWIEPAARDALLAACREHLAPDGVAYVSYDVLPGGHLREITRQMLRWHLRDVDEPEERIAQARALLAAIVEAAPGRRRDAPRRRARVAAGGPVDLPRRARAAPRGGAVHRLRRPRGRARPAVPRRGRRVRDGGRRPARRSFAERPDRARAVPRLLQGPDVPADAAVPHGRRARAQAGLEIVRGMLAATPARPVDENAGRVEFRGPSGASLTTDHDGVKAALTRLGEAWPAALPVAELGDDPAVAETLRRAYAANLVRLHVWAPELTTTPSERPVASALARLQAAEGTRVTTLLHTTVEVGDELGLRLIRLLDGTRDRAALVAELGRPAGRARAQPRGASQDRAARALTAAPPTARRSRRGS